MENRMAMKFRVRDKEESVWRQDSLGGSTTF